MNNTITWLHISDIHACKPKTGWDAKRVLATLQADLYHLYKKHNLRPDLVFFTGDAAFGHLGDGDGKSIREQFCEADEFLTKVRETYSQAIPKRNLFLVPGNHDVNRTVIAKFETQYLTETHDLTEIQNLIRDKPIEWSRIRSRLSDYEEFLADNGYDHLLEDRDRLIYSANREIAGVNIGIAGFNSAWSSTGAGRQELGQLWMAGRFQMETICPTIESSDFKIALLHHPGNWLVPEENPHFLNELKAEFEFVLHGHEHHQFVEASGVDGHVVISAGACHEWSQSGQNGYSVVSINLESQTVDVWLREYESTGRSWRPRVINRRTDSAGRCQLPATKAWLANLSSDIATDSRKDQVSLAEPESESENPIHWSHAGAFEFYRNWLAYLPKALKELKPSDVDRLSECCRQFGRDIETLPHVYVEPDLQQFSPSDDIEDQVSREQAFARIARFLSPGVREQQMFVLSDAGMGKTSLLVMLHLGNIAGLWPRGLKTVLIKLNRGMTTTIKAVEDKQNTVLLLDALDEDPMAWGNIENRIEQLLRLTTVFARVIITCRTQFFKDTDDIFHRRGNVTISGHSCPVAYVSLFNHRQVNQFLFNLFPPKDGVDDERIPQARRLVKKMGSLQMRPMLLAHIEDLMSADNEVEWNEFTIYQALVDTWLQREAIKEHAETVSANEYRTLLWAGCEQLACHLYASGEREISYDALDRLVRRHTALAHIQTMDIGGRSLLNKNSDGDYRFSHLSVEEFLVVFHVTCSLCSLKFKRVSPTHQMMSFLRSWIENVKTKRSQPRLGAFDYSRHSMKNWRMNGLVLDQGQFEQSDLTGTQFEECSLRQASFRGSTLNGASFKNATCEEATFADAKLSDVILSSASLQKANLNLLDLRTCTVDGLVLTGASLVGSILRELDLQTITCDEVDLTDGDLRDCTCAGVSFMSSNFNGADLRNANFGRANLSSCTFNGARLTFAAFDSCRFDSATLRGVEFKGCSLAKASFNEASCRDSIFDRVDVQEALFVNTNLMGGSFKAANLSGSRFMTATLERCQFNGASLDDVVFETCNLQYAAFEGTDLKATSFVKCTFRENNFRRSNLLGCRLANIDLARSNFSNADLRSTDFTNSKLDGCRFSGAELDETDFSGASLLKAEFAGVIPSTVSLCGAQIGKCDWSGMTLEKINFSNADMSGAILQDSNLRGADLSGTNLSGAKLRGANLSGANLMGTVFHKCALAKAKLNGAAFGAAKLDNLDLQNAEFENSNLRKASFHSSRLDGARFLSVSFERCILNKASVEGGEFQRCKIMNSKIEDVNLKNTSIVNCTFQETSFVRSNLSGCNLSSMTFNHVDFSHANVDSTQFGHATFECCKFSNVELAKANFSGAKLSKADWSGMALKHGQLSNADLTSSVLLNTDLSHANLSQANISTADLTGATLVGANLAGADLTGANLMGADLTGTNLTGANLTGANLQKANLTSANLTDANLQQADFKECKIAGAVFERANRRDAIGLPRSHRQESIRGL